MCVCVCVCVCVVIFSSANVQVSCRDGSWSKINANWVIFGEGF